jgi:hypothetical protein
MITNFRRHIWYYLVTILIFGLGLTLIALNSEDTKTQAMLIPMTATCYFLWSLLHHYIHHELHLWVVVEYMLFAVLGIVLSLYLFSI